jgi:hypothetical protein
VSSAGRKRPDGNKKSTGRFLQKQFIKEVASCRENSSSCFLLHLLP